MNISKTFKSLLAAGYSNKTECLCKDTRLEWKVPSRSVLHNSLVPCKHYRAVLPAAALIWVCRHPEVLGRWHGTCTVYRSDRKVLILSARNGQAISDVYWLQDAIYSCRTDQLYETPAFYCSEVVLSLLRGI